MSGAAGAMFLAGGYTVTLSGETISSVNAAGAVAGVRINTDGTVDKDIDAVFSRIDNATDWIRPLSAASSSYEARATVQSGTLDSGTVDEWLAIDDNLTWSVVATPGNTAAATILLEIRLGTTTLASGTYILSADASP